MLNFDDTLLIELGLGMMAEDERPIFLQYVQETLELRIGTELAKVLSEPQLAAFQRLAQTDEQIALMDWLEEHCPSYPQVVMTELEKIKQEIISRKHELLNS